MTGPDCARNQSLKQLTIFEDKRVHIFDRLAVLLSIFRHCPKIEHVAVKVYYAHDLSISSLDPLLMIHNTVLAWRSLHKEANLSSLEAEETTVSTAESFPAPSSHETQGPQILDIHIHERRSPVTGCNVRFLHGCQDMVSLAASIHDYNAWVIICLFHSFKHSL